MYIEFWLEDLEERDHLVDLSLDGEDNIKTHRKETGWKGMDWINLAHDIAQRQDSVKTGTNIWVP